MQHEGSNLLRLLRRHLTAVIVAGLTGVTTALLTSKYGWPGAVSGAALVPMFTTTISTIYTDYVDRVVKTVYMTDRPAPPPFDPSSRAPRLPKLSQVSAALRWFSLRVSPERRRSILDRGLQ